jgi:multidrug resistance protein
MKGESIWHNQTLITICIAEMIYMIGMGFVSPILPKFVQSLGVSPALIGTTVGLLFTVYGIARAVMDIPAGRLSQRFGRRPLLIFGPVLMSLSALGCGLATQYWQLILFRLLQGFGSAAFSVTAIISIGEISTSYNRGQYMSIYFASFLIGSSLGPTFGGFLGEYFGYRVPFFCFAGLALLAAFWGYRRIPETKGLLAIPEDIDNPSNLPKNTWFSNLNFWLVCLVTMFTLVSVIGNQLTLVPILGYERLKLSEGQVGLTLTLVAAMQLILALLAGRLSDRFGRKIIIVPGGIISVLGLLMFTQSYSYGFLLLSALVLGIGRGFGGPIPAAYVADIAPKGSYESFMSVYRTANDIGFVIGAIFLGWLKDIYGLDFPFFLGAGLLLTAIIAFGTLAKETVHRRSSSAS